MNRYKIIKSIGEGGNGSVYLARDTNTGKMVTIKRPKYGLEDLTNEAVVLSELHHEGIPGVIDRFGDSVVLEYMPGKSLEKIISEEGLLTEKKTVDIAKELLKILSYLHSREVPVIYRDLKPANIVMKPDGHIALIDFGAARFYSPQNDVDTVNLGTFGFAAPEQYGNLGQTDKRTDIYCFGMTLLQLMTGVDPKDSEKVLEIRQNGTRRVSGEFLAIIEKCIRTDRDDRYSDADEIFKDIKRYPIKRVVRKVMYLGKLAVAACLVSVVISMAVSFVISVDIMIPDDLREFITDDFNKRLPTLLERLGNARSRIDGFVKNIMNGRLL